MISERLKIFIKIKAMAIRPLHGSVIYYFSPLNKRFKCKLTINDYIFNKFICQQLNLKRRKI